MKKVSTLFCIFLLLVAAVTGWFLPIADFAVYDKYHEGESKELDIRQINLSYREDLSMSQKVCILKEDYGFYDAVELDRGIFLEKTELVKILNDFMYDLTGRHCNVEDDMQASPFLVSFEDNMGTTVIWGALCSYRGWTISFFVDDKTGALLGCRFYGDADNATWGDLIVGCDDALNGYNFVSGKFCTAIYHHYVTRLDAKLVTYNILPNHDSGDVVEYMFVFKDDKNYTFQLNIRFSMSDTMAETF